MPRILAVDPLVPSPIIIEEAAALIRAGKLVAFPTETVYGLGADATSDDAVRSIYTAKGRPSTNPLIVHVAEVEQARAIATEWPESAQILTEEFWPGPLTIILPRREGMTSSVVSAGASTVALRMPDHPVALALIAQAGVPIAAPSANKSGHTSPTRTEHVARSLGDAVPLILDAGPLSGGIESTVIDLSTNTPRLLRPGLLSITEIERLIGPVERVVISAGPSDELLTSPGQLTRHYAPYTRLMLSSNIDADLLAHAGQKIGAIVMHPIDLADAVTHAMPTNPDGYARELYHALHELDQQGLDLIIAEVPPETDEWLGVRDRLKRAAA